MRIFVAIDLPRTIIAALASLQQQLHPVTNSVRWVDPESLHVTLKFIGETPEQKVKEIDSTLRDVHGKAFRLAARGLGFFPNPRSPRVFWVGLEGEQLAALTGDIEGRLEKLRIPREKRPFKPHLTLARSRGDRMDASIVAAVAGLETRDFGRFEVDRFFLYQSTLGREGAMYVKLYEYLLTTEARRHEEILP